AAHEVVGFVDVVELEARRRTALALRVGTRTHDALNEATERLDRARGRNALWAPADADAHVEPALVARGVDAARDIPVEHEAGAGSGGANVVYELLVPRTVEHADEHLVDRLALDFRERPDVLAD